MNTTPMHPSPLAIIAEDYRRRGRRTAYRALATMCLGIFLITGAESILIIPLPQPVAIATVVIGIALVSGAFLDAMKAGEYSKIGSFIHELDEWATNYATDDTDPPIPEHVLRRLTDDH